MKFWFSKKSSKAPYDATVEQTLLFVQEVNATSSESESQLPDLATALRQPEHAAPAPRPQLLQVSPPPAQAPAPRQSAASKSMREELQRRSANYRAFQMKLNEEREERIRKTMNDVRASLQSSAPVSRPLH